MRDVRIVHAEGYIHVFKEGHGKHEVRIRQPAIRLTIQMGEEALICADALPEWNSVDDWAEAFASECEVKITARGFVVDHAALRSEYAKLAKDAILALDRGDLAIDTIH